MQDSLTNAYLEISELLKIQCAPVGVVWQNILNDTTLVLHSGDNSHPNIDGSYVAALTIFSSIWKQGTSGLNYTAGLSNKLAQYYQSKSDNTIFNSANDWNLLINNPSANFSELISGYTATFTNLSTSINKTLNYFWDFGDGNTSSTPNPNHTYTTIGKYNVKLIASNCIFSDTISKTIQIGTTSIEENIVEVGDFSLYPNPALNQINLKTDSRLLGSNYTVYDKTGKSVINGKIIAEQTVVELGNLSRGIYLLSIGENFKQTFKVIKE
jgi:PKD repeat protein